jgi:PAS domain S-box-containing protein
MYKRSLEYEKAIDESNILSRTDIHGKITYVNQAFCDISGYSKEELMRSSHNIVRDPAADPKMFQQLWNTIGKGRVWKGSFKNRKKNGEAYYVSTSIVPIMDDNGSIVEYMGIRHDVTEIVMLHKELEDTQKEIIQKIGEVGETRSKETGYHVKRVAEYSRLLALLAGLGKKNAQLLYYASPMHDIGKIGIPDSILKKAGKLDEDEFKVMRTHAEIGYHILKGSKREILKAAAIVAYRHHERWDGTGYPNALLGEQIHIFGRITTIADVFDALGSKRVYKEAWELEKILEYFKEQRGKHFDPKLIDIFFNNLDKFLKIRDRFKDVV